MSTWSWYLTFWFCQREGNKTCQFILVHFSVLAWLNCKPVGISKSQCSFWQIGVGKIILKWICCLNFHFLSISWSETSDKLPDLQPLCLHPSWTPPNAGAVLQLFVVFLHPAAWFLKLREWRREASLRDYLTSRFACILLPRQVTGVWHSLFLTSSPGKMLVTRSDPWANF